ncbi:MAG: hypothetical protein IT342_01670 [Candidatus Melainabacteria bacterium]|nr:hypothetical protein [Candidatus Melainabacteria bacterium]
MFNLHFFYLPCLLFALGIFAIRVLGGGEDWYDVWNEGGHCGWFGNDGWFSGYGEFFRFLLFSTAVIVGLGFLWAVTPGTLRAPDPAYEESTPIKVASSTPARAHKKVSHKKKAAAKRHTAGRKRVLQ